ncbi:hypothetical protein ACW9HQ_50115 [Nocardia gipuzkoensis]
MPRWGDFLDRFRPAGAPGAAGAAGIPADRATDAAMELTPVLTRLDEVQDRADTMRTEALERAARIRHDSETVAAEIVARAHAKTLAVQPIVAESVELPAEPDDDPELARHIEQRLPDYVDRVVSIAREILGELHTAPKELADR